MVRCLVAIAVVLSLVASAGADHLPGVGEVPFENVLKKRLPNSEEFSVPIFLPPSASGTSTAGWVGTAIKIHVLDSSEVDVASVVLYGPTAGTNLIINDPLGPRSQNVQSKALAFPMFHVGPDTIRQSGIDGPTPTPTQTFAVGEVKFHAKGTSVGQNSDVDVTVMAGNLIHLHAGSSMQIGPSDFVFAPADFIPTLENPLPTVSTSGTSDPIGGGGSTVPMLPEGKLVHVPFQFHAGDGQGSNIIATFRGGPGIALGIDHVPEPMSSLMWGGGIVCAAIGLRCRKRRLAHADIPFVG